MNAKTRMGIVTFVTFVRVPLVFAFFALAIADTVVPNPPGWLFPLSGFCLVLAALSDAVDGTLARKLKVTSSFGAYADPLTDKIFYLTALPLLVFLSAHNGHITHSVVLLCFTVLFMFRDQWVSFLRSIGSMYGAKADANWSGKLRTLISFPVICLVYYYEAAESPIIGQRLLYVFEAIGTLINLVSIWVYTASYWPYVRKSARTE